MTFFLTRKFYLVSIFIFACLLNSSQCKKTEESSANSTSFQIADGVRLAIGDGESDDLFKLNIDLSTVENVFEGRSKDKKLLRRILPMFILPFLIQSAILPMFLSTLKMMLVKSLMVGKLALILIAVNAIRTSNAFKGRGEERLAQLHYGFHGSGMDEVGAMINRRGF